MSKFMPGHTGVLSLQVQIPFFPLTVARLTLGRMSGCGAMMCVPTSLWKVFYSSIINVEGIFYSSSHLWIEPFLKVDARQVDGRVRGHFSAEHQRVIPLLIVEVVQIGRMCVGPLVHHGHLVLLFECLDPAIGNAMLRNL